MLHLDLTLPNAQQNLACDEALLDWCEAGSNEEVLRFWEPAQYFVVVGYGNKVASEVDLDFCQQRGVPVLRRCTGGGTVLQGPGCLNYSLLLRVDGIHPVQNIAAANRFIMDRHRETLSAILGAPVVTEGHTDLAVGGLKFSGNAQRRRKRCLLFHGTFLLHLDIEMVEKALRMPSAQPDYRLSRSHTDFLMNLHAPAHVLKEALLRCWGAGEAFGEVPTDRIEALARERYGAAEWNFKF